MGPEQNSGPRACPQRAAYLMLRMPSGVYPRPLPTADRIHVSQPDGRSTWLEWRVDGDLVGFGPIGEDA